MRELKGRIQTLPKAKTIALTVFVSVFSLLAYPISTSAVTSPSRVTVSQSPENLVSTSVQPPGTTNATSLNDNKNIVWVWGMPAGGLTPDATNNEGEEPVTHATDIIGFGYELSLQGTVVISGTVGSGTQTVTTPVTDNGKYDFRVWSITRVGQMSAYSEGSITIFTPIVVSPPQPAIEAPAAVQPIGGSNAGSKPAANAAPSKPTATPDGETPTTTPEADAGVLSATNGNDLADPVSKAAVIAPSKEGWVILGMAWYVWLVIAAVIYSLVRLVFWVIEKRGMGTA